MEKQKTIKDVISFSGKGIHTGVLTNINILPAKENTGIKFIRTDLKEKPIIEANIDNLFITKRSTSLKKNNNEVHTVEHLLAAITGASIDNVIIEIDNIEVPILDGSSIKYTKEIENTGLKIQNAEKKYFEIKKNISFKDDKTGTEFFASPSNNFEIEVIINYNCEQLEMQQHAEINDISKFNTDISPSRTFCFLHELEDLINNNLVKGGDINNAIVLVDKKIEEKQLLKIKKIFNNQKIQINKNGTLNNLELRFENEPARHKILDLIGDLTLLGKPIKGKIKVFKPGHKNNTKFAKKLKKIMSKEKLKLAPEIKWKEKPLYNKEKIKSILPHRDPFLFIDEIRDLGEDYIIGVKYVKANEEYFKGHFPNEPVMPGVLQLETMAQAGGVLILNTVENPQDYLTFFMKIDNAKFKQKVVPGNTIIFKLNLLSPIRRGLCHMHGIGFVDDKIVVEADLLAQIAPKK